MSINALINHLFFILALLRLRLRHRIQCLIIISVKKAIACIYLFRFVALCFAFICIQACESSFARCSLCLWCQALGFSAIFAWIKHLEQDSRLLLRYQGRESQQVKGRLPPYLGILTTQRRKISKQGVSWRQKLTRRVTLLVRQKLPPANCCGILQCRFFGAHPTNYAPDLFV